MKIVIGTTAAPKINAIEEGIKRCVYFQGVDIEIIPLKVDSNISYMPLSLEENMTGAFNRAKNAKKEIEADLYIGMEGGTSKIGEKSYLFGVVYILNNIGNGHYGISPMMEVPQVFDKRLYENGEDLGNVLQEITGIEGASKKTGGFGAWSDDMLTRKDQFLLAFLTAIVPFYNKYYKI